MIGATIGAGVGPVQGELGLMIDALESVRIITASGSIISASRTENAELFWGIRGAGANFGIITSATYKVPEAINKGNVLNADFLFLPQSSPAIWQILKSFDDTLPSQLTLNIGVAFNQTINQVGPATFNFKTTIELTMVNHQVTDGCQRCVFWPCGGGYEIFTATFRSRSGHDQQRHSTMEQAYRINLLRHGFHGMLDWTVYQHV
jgi:hypothetical protein